MVGQRLPSGTWTFRASNGVARLVVSELLDFLVDSRQVGIPGFLEHIALQWCQDFAFGAEADALVIRQLMRQCGDFDVFGLDEFGIPLILFHSSRLFKDYKSDPPYGRGNYQYY